MLERMTGQGMNGVLFRQDCYTDLDFADDVSLLAKLLELLDGKWGNFARVRSELAEDKGLSFGHHGECATICHS